MLAICDNLVGMAWLRQVAKASDAESQEVERIARDSATMSSRILKAFLDAVRILAASLDLKLLADLLRQNRVSEAIAIVDEQALIAGMTPIAEAATEATIDAGQSAVTAMRSVPGLNALHVSFGITNPQTIADLRTYEMSKIRELSSGALASVRQAITVGVQQGRNPLDVARDVREFIGLTATQTAAVQNYRSLLENRDSAALARQLRDKRFDPTVARSVRDDTPLTTDQIDKMVGRYRDRYLKYRSETIARTEAIRAVNKGNLLAWGQTVASGKIGTEQVTRRWIYTHDSRTRHAHRTIPLLNPDGVGIDEPFDSELGPIMFPGDESADPANVINCFTGDMRPTFVSPVKRLMRRWYVGPLLRIRLERAGELAVTPNHPMLTIQGRKLASNLIKGDYLVYSGETDSLSFGRPNPNASPSTFAEIFNFAQVAFQAERIHGSLMDFHGDGIESDIDIVSADGLLPDWLETTCDQRFQNLLLTEPSLIRRALSVDSPSTANLVGIRLAASNSVRRSRELFPLLWARVCHAAKHAFRTIGDHDTVFLKAAFDHQSLRGHCGGNSFHALAGCISFDNRNSVNLSSALIASAPSNTGFNAFSTKSKKPKTDAMAKRFNNTVKSHSISIGRDRVVEIVRQEVFSGHVYNSETETGVYLANGVGNCNCRCTQIIRFLPSVKKSIPVVKFDPSEPRDEQGKWTSGGAASLMPAGADRGQWPDHIKALKLPPAWTDVQISNDPNAALQAIGLDAKGRAQYVYSEEFSQYQSAAKFERITRLQEAAAGIEKVNASNQLSADDVMAQHADATALVMKMGVRPGSESDTGAELKAYGATTLEGRHVIVEGDKTSLQFIGKDGVSLNLPVNDSGLATMLQDRAAAAGPNGQLFPKVSNSSLSTYVHSIAGDFKTKDFRTLLGSQTAMKEVESATIPTSMAAYKAAVKGVAVKVSKVLGNTPSVALSSYINPVVFVKWRAAVG